MIFLGSIQTKKDFNTQITEWENTENDSEVYQRYVLLMTEYLKLRESQDNDPEYKNDFSNIEQQIDDINTNMSGIDEKVENLINAADKSNDNVIIASVITGVCAIIAALIARK